MVEVITFPLVTTKYLGMMQKLRKMELTALSSLFKNKKQVKMAQSKVTNGSEAASI